MATHCPNVPQVRKIVQVLPKDQKVVSSSPTQEKTWWVRDLKKYNLVHSDVVQITHAHNV